MKNTLSTRWIQAMTIGLMVIGFTAVPLLAQELPPRPAADERKPVDEFEEEENAFYGGPFKPRPGIAGTIGFTTGGIYASFNLMRQFSPDQIGFLSIGFTTARDAQEIDRIDFFGNTFTFGPDPVSGQLIPKQNGILMMPVTVGLQQRLFRRDITNSFRPFVEVGLGPTVGYVFQLARLNPGGNPSNPDDYDYSFRGGIFNPRYVTIGANGFVGAGAYFGNNFMMLQGLTVRYVVNAFPTSVELLRGFPLNVFHGIALNLVFGTLL